MWGTIGGFFDVEFKESLITRIEHESQSPEYWNDNRAAKKKQAELSAAKSDLETWLRLKNSIENLQTSAELLEMGDDDSILEEFAREKTQLLKLLSNLDFHRMLSGPYDRKNAILNVHPGAGGTESQDWAQILLRMYSRWAESKGFKIEVLDLQPGEEAGIKNATIRIEGEWAYGMLRSEKGVHRLVRISPFDSNKRRHTSFASVEPTPEMDEDVELEIDEKDLKIDVFRASGAGGQHVNRTESAVRITHIPTGFVVQCQNDRSQLKNKASAMSVLKSRLYVRAQEEKKQRMESIAGEKKDINFGSQVRSYVLQPYQQIKDHRTDIDYPRVEKILDGDLDQMIEDCLRKESLVRS